MADKKTASEKRVDVRRVRKMADSLKKMVGSQMTESEGAKLKKLYERIDRRLESELGPAVTKSGKPKGRNPHVGINIPKTSNEELIKRRRAARKKKPGTVRASSKRRE